MSEKIHEIYMDEKGRNKVIAELQEKIRLAEEALEPIAKKFIHGTNYCGCHLRYFENCEYYKASEALLKLRGEKHGA